MVPSPETLPMIPEIQVFIGMLLLSAGLSYAWWVHFRVWMLRQDLFTIRDQLWDAMNDRGILDDPAHRELRDSLNALIRIAPLLSIFTFLRILAEGAHPRAIGASQDTDPEIETARRRAVSRLKQYLFLETALGIGIVLSVSFICLLILMPARIARQVISRMVEKVFSSTELIAMGSFMA